MPDVTSSISIARFEPWTEREGGGQMRSGKRESPNEPCCSGAMVAKWSPRQFIACPIGVASMCPWDVSRLCSDGPPDDMRRPRVSWTVCGELVDDRRERPDSAHRLHL